MTQENIKEENKIRPVYTSEEHSAQRRKRELAGEGVFAPTDLVKVACMHGCSVASVMSNSLRRHGLYPTRLLCPWNSPGKNTGVNYHSLLQGIFLTQGSHLCLLRLLHCRRILYCWATMEAPYQGWAGEMDHTHGPAFPSCLQPAAIELQDRVWEDQLRRPYLCTHCNSNGITEKLGKERGESKEKKLTWDLVQNASEWILWWVKISWGRCSHRQAVPQGLILQLRDLTYSCTLKSIQWILATFCGKNEIDLLN